MTPPRRLLSALLLGAASVAAFAPLGWFPLVWLTLGGFYALLATADRPRTGALLGAAFGFGLFATGVSWVYVSLSVFGGMAAPLAGLATVLFCAVLSVYPALAGAVFVRFAAPGRWLRSLYFAALWMLGEWLRAWVFTGFPWLAVGYAQVPASPLAGFAPLIGVFGVSLATALTAALGCEAVFAAVLSAMPRRSPDDRASRWSHWRSTALPLLAVAVLLGAGAILRKAHWTTPDGPPLSVALLQGNIAQDIKWRPEGFEQSLRTYYHLARENPAQLIVLPEAAFPVFLEQLPPEYLDELRKIALTRQGDLLFGIVTGSLNEYANSAVSLGQSDGQRYSKAHLVPFGEFVPPGFSWFLSLANIPMSGFTPGALKQPPLNIAGQKVAVNICYEDAFGEEIIGALPDATLLVNLSNVAWFGDSLAPAQHLQIAQMRALESGRMMLRATNTGMTAIIGADGSVEGVLPPFTRAALRGQVRAYLGATPYVRWGNWPAIVFALLLVAIVARRNALSFGKNAENARP
jgi:apolipoprotein N-acyltransferase